VRAGSRPGLSPRPSQPSPVSDKIVAKKIPSTAVYEDDLSYAFRDVSPCAETHILIVPKEKGGLTQLQHATEADKPLLGHLMYVAALVARQEGLQQGYRLVVNDGPQGCQSVYHLHLHLIGGRQLSWPPGVPGKGAMTG
jgi:histidine triad (HIT) family protein